MVLERVILLPQMPSETRNLEEYYFESHLGLVGRTERVRGDFDAYDGSFETMSVKWWLELDGHRSDTTPGTN